MKPMVYTDGRVIISAITTLVYSRQSIDVWVQDQVFKAKEFIYVTQKRVGQ